jgi:hypothetical protein
MDADGARSISYFSNIILELRAQSPQELDVVHVMNVAKVRIKILVVIVYLSNQAIHVEGRNTGARHRRSKAEVATTYK